MKIFNVEDGVKKVYVQKNDLGMMGHAIDVVPATIYNKMMFGTREVPETDDPVEYMMSGITIIDNSNRMEFLEYSEPHEIKFFEDQDWIIDYKELRYLSEDELKERMDALVDEMNAIAEKYNAMSEEERGKNQDLATRHELLDYKLHTIPLVRWIQKGEEQIPFPVVPDSDGFKFSKDDIEYQIQGSLDPNKILLFRKDGKPLEKNEKVPNGFIQMGMSIAIMERQDKNLFVGDLEVKHSFSDDQKYFITEYKITEPVKDEEEREEEMPEEQENAPEAPVKQTQERGLRRLLNRLLGKKQ